MTNEELVKAIQEGENVKDNLEVLYLQNRGIIEKIVNRFKGCHDPEDLRQEAFFGIANAARSWSRGTGAPFINYAVFHVRRVIVDYIRRDQFSISDHVIKDLMRYRKAVQAYREQYSRDPSEDELRELLHLSADKLRTIKCADRARAVSLSAPIGDAEGVQLTLADTLPDTAEPFEDLLDRIQREEMSAELWSCVDCLEDLQRDVIRDRYREDHSVKECSMSLDVPAETVKRTEARALRELRKPKHAHRLLPYVPLSQAYSYGLRGTGVSAFNRYGSSQEQALMRLELITGQNMYGVKINAEQENA